MNKNRFQLALAWFLGVVATFLAMAPAQAVPAFARQTGKACSTCHFQHYPALNDYGRDFKASGFVDMGKQGTLKGSKTSELSLPDVLNASIFMKARYQKSNGTDLPNTPTTASGEWQAPDEFALLLAGRISSNIGFLIEAQMADQAAPLLAGFKMPFMYDVGGKKMGVIPFTTDGLGVAYGFELLNTGAVRNVRIAEHRSETSAQQYIGTATPAFGAAFVLSDPSYFINFTRWSPAHAATAEGRTGNGPSANYLRAAYLPSWGEWDIGMGVQLWSGSARVDDDSGNGTDHLVQTKAWAIDFQAQGNVGGKPMGIYLAHANAAGQKPGETNLFNTAPKAKTATTITVEYGVLPQKATIMAAYRVGNNGKATNATDNALTLGGTYQIAQNVQLQLLHSTRSGHRYGGSATPGSAQTTLMLSAGY